MTITKTNWRDLYNNAKTITERNGILNIAEHNEWGEADERAIVTAAERNAREVHALIMNGGGIFAL